MKNKNITLIFTVFAVFLATVSFNLKAQKFEKGNKDLNLTIGVGTLWNRGYNMQLPLISVSGDYGLTDKLGPGVIGVGAYLGIATFKSKNAFYGWALDYGYKYTDICFAARGTYHYQFVKKLDTYGGIILGFRLERGKYYGNWPGGLSHDAVSDPHFLPAIFVGGKYYLTNKFSVLAELGIGTALLNVGVGMKF